MIKLLGMADMIMAGILFLIAFNVSIPSKIIIFFALFLIIKGVIFIKSWISFLDILAGIVIFLSIKFMLPKTLLVIVAILLLQKGILSVIIKK